MSGTSGWAAGGGWRCCCLAALVSSLAGAWGLAEIFGWQHSLNARPGRRTAPFYLTYTLAHVAGAVLVLASVDLIGALTARA
jgi:hypothetical protein